MSPATALFDTQRLRMLLDPEVRRTLLAPGALEGLVMVLHVAELFRSALDRLGVPADLLDRVARTAPTNAEAAAELRAYLDPPAATAEDVVPAPPLSGFVVRESSP